MENYKHIVGLLSCALVVSGGMMLTGCTDDNYDLGSLDKTEGRSDVNGDGEVGLADVNALIDLILSSP